MSRTLKSCLFFFSWFVAILVCLQSLLLSAEANMVVKNAQHQGLYKKWEPIEIQFKGPFSNAKGNPNPFDMFIDVEFVAPDQRRLLVPGYYDGNGQGKPDGNIWAVRFSADLPGLWHYRSLSRKSELYGYHGTFEVVERATDNEEDGYFRFGILEYPDTENRDLRYLKFRDGPYWMKAGCDDPENFLGKSSNFNTVEKRKEAIDFLSSRGVNSLYMMTHNIEGDMRDVWPWLGATEKEAKQNAGLSARFDIGKLREWQALFEYMQKKEVVPYLILEDDSAWTGYDYKRYYREIIARFGYLPALIVNFGEEFRENHWLLTGVRRARYFRSLDPFKHPLGIHDINNPELLYVGSGTFDFSSIQTKGDDPFVHNEIALRWQRTIRKHGFRSLMIGFDEPRPEFDRRGWWAAYLGGAVWQLHAVPPYDVPHHTREPAWTQLGGARQFMESLPFWEMVPDNSVVIGGKGYCLRKGQGVYALYLPEGTAIQLDLPEGNKYRVQWWNPDNGRTGSFMQGDNISSDKPWLTPPDNRDWAVRLDIVE